MPAETPRCGGPAGRRITVGSYNIHSCVGSDNRYDPGRIQSVIADLDADVVGLQEVGERARHARSIDHFDFLSDETGMHVIAGPNLIDNGSPYGNVLLSRWPVTDYRLIRLNVPNREPRGAIAAVVRCVDRNVRFVNTHLGLRRRERRLQLEMLRDALSDVELPTVFLGDYNMWGRGQRALRAFGAPSSATAPKTFPSKFPILALDRIWGGPGTKLTDIEALKSPVTRKASDHLPLRAIIELPAARFCGHRSP